MRNPPPSLLSLTLDTAVLNLSRIDDLSHLPDHIVLDLFARTLRAGKLNVRVLGLFMDSGNEEVLSLVDELKIETYIFPVLPTDCHGDYRSDWFRKR